MPTKLGRRCIENKEEKTPITSIKRENDKQKAAFKKCSARTLLNVFRY